jgi:predicted acetyltransferase
LCAYVLQICLPGEGATPATAVIDVGVLSEWRGSGFLRELMTTFIHAAHERHEPLAVLNSDEETLYLRFGFGVASRSRRVSIAPNAKTREDSDPESTKVEAISDLEASSVLPELFSALAVTRLGEVTRTSSWWREYFDDAARGPVPTEFAVSASAGVIDGYVALQLPDRPILDAALVVAELFASTAASAEALVCHSIGRAGELPLRFRSCPIDFDVTASVESAAVVVVDAPKPQLWLRLIDVADALPLRRYAGPARLVFDVADEVAPWNTGRFALEVDASGSAAVERTTESPAFEIGPVALAAVFLGGTSFSELATNGEVVEREPGALSVADAVFATSSAPFCSTLL